MPPTVDPIQQVITEMLKDGLRRQAIDRALAKEAIRFLSQPMGRSLHLKLKAAEAAWSAATDDAALLATVAALAAEFSKARPLADAGPSLRREDLRLICFEYVTA